MSHHFNNLTSIRNTLQTTMMECWKEGRKRIDQNPHEGEIYFIVGTTCMELISKLQEEIDEEVSSWHQ